jgi:uncharacterized protein
MDSIILGGTAQQYATLDLNMANRHGLIAGATGTGKTVTLQVLTEQFSAQGVPVFVVDVKGDLSGLACSGSAHPKISERLNTIGLSHHHFAAAPVVFWDVFGKLGQPIRATVSDIGPLLLANLLELNDTQTGVLYACFKVADEHGLLMLDLDDLKAMLKFVSEQASSLQGQYGNISSASVGAIMRRLLILEEQGIAAFLGEPALELNDMLSCDLSGRGLVNIFDVSQLIHRSPKLYATILLWLLAEVFEELPEVGDLAKPKFVLFFDEAHLLFSGAPKVLVEKIEQIVRLIRSKAVGVYFVTQSPLDIPSDIAGQLGLKIQHALRGFSAKDRKTITAVADNFRPNPAFDSATVIAELGMGEALISALDAQGRPTQVARCLIAPPMSRIGPTTDEEREAQMSRSPHRQKYSQSINRESAYELLAKRAEKAMLENQQNPKTAPTSRARQRQGIAESFFKSVTRAIGSQIGRQLVRGVLGSLFKK